MNSFDDFLKVLCDKGQSFDRRDFRPWNAFRKCFSSTLTDVLNKAPTANNVYLLHEITLR